MTSADDTLQGYFDDLLIGAPEDEEASIQAQEPLPQAAVKPAAAEPEQHQQAELERQQQAREKLAKLLVSTPPEVKTEKVVEAAVEAPVEVAQQVETVEQVKTVEQVETEVSTESRVEQPQVEVVKPQTELEEPETETEILESEALKWADNGRPQWAQERFDVLLFEVAGLTLAVPLIALGQIQPLTDELTPLFGQADWFMGLQPTPVGKIRTINTAKFVMPERYEESFLQAAKYVVSINGLPWGLAVDAVNQPITLEPEDVKWRGERSKRPWLAGTVKQHMCALLDVAAMGELLQQADSSGSRKDPLSDS